MSLSRSVHDQVGGPSEELQCKQVSSKSAIGDFDRQLRFDTHLLNEEIVEAVDGSVLEELLQVGSVDLDGFSLSFGSNFLGRGRGNEDFLSSHVSGSGVVLGVGDSPRVVGDEDEGVENESDGIVEGFRGRESLVTAWRMPIRSASIDGGHKRRTDTRER